MRIISSRKFRFYTPDRSESFVTEGKNIIQDCPDWAKDDATFQAALSANLLQVISSASAQRKLEKEPEKILPQNAHEAKALLEEPQSKVHMSEEASEKIQEEAQEAPKKKRNRKKKAKE